MANLDGSGLSEVWVRAAQLVKRFTGAVNLTKGDLQTQVDTKITGTAISSSSAITTQGEYALDAREKNASVEGTLANQISTLNSNLNLPSFMSSFWGICEDANNPTAFIISGVTQNAPDGVNYPVILTMPQRDTADYLGQICFSVTAQGSDNLYVRNKRGDTWKPWYMVNLTAI